MMKSNWLMYLRIAMAISWQYHRFIVKTARNHLFFFLILMILMKSNWQMYLRIAVAISWQYRRFFVKGARNHLFILTTSLNWYLIVLGAKWRSNAYQQWLTFFFLQRLQLHEKKNHWQVLMSIPPCRKHLISFFSKLKGSPTKNLDMNCTFVFFGWSLKNTKAQLIELWILNYHKFSRSLA